MLSKVVLSLLAVNYATAAAAPHIQGLPEAFVSIMAKPVEATYECHANCGYAIIAARECTTNTEDEDAGPYTDSCLCASDSQFMSLVPACLDCGWCLWDDYGTFLTAPLAACSTSTEPTGSTCAPSTTAAAAETTSTTPETTSTAATEAAEATVDTTSSTEAAAETTAAETTSTEAAAAAVKTTSSTEAAAAAAETTSTEAAVETTSSTEAAATTSAAVAAAETTSAEATSSAAPTVATSSAVPTVATSSAVNATSIAVSTFTGGANKLAIGAGSVLVGLAAFLI